MDVFHVGVFHEYSKSIPRAKELIYLTEYCMKSTTYMYGNNNAHIQIIMVLL